MNYQLEEALMYAARVNDIASLKALARQESARADRFVQLLSAVLAVSGPIRIKGDLVSPDGACIEFRQVEGGLLVANAPCPPSTAADLQG